MSHESVSLRWLLKVIVADRNKFKIEDHSKEEIEARLKEIDREWFQLLEDLRKQKQQEREACRLPDIDNRLSLVPLNKKFQYLSKKVTTQVLNAVG